MPTTLRKWAAKRARDMPACWIGAEATSISLFLAGPLGSQEDSTWNDWALEIELDEKVCRKIVWLLPENPTEMDAVHFLDGTPRSTVETSRGDRSREVGLTCPTRNSREMV